MFDEQGDFIYKEIHASIAPKRIHSAYKRKRFYLSLVLAMFLTSPLEPVFFLNFTIAIVASLMMLWSEIRISYWSRYL